MTSSTNIAYGTPKTNSGLYFVWLKVVAWNILPAFMFNLMAATAQCLKILDLVVRDVSISVMYNKIRFTFTSLAESSFELFVDVEVISSGAHYQMITQSV